MSIVYLKQCCVNESNLHTITGFFKIVTFLQLLVETEIKK